MRSSHLISGASWIAARAIGYRRIAALLKRERRSAGHGPVNAKRVYRLMKKSGLLLARHTVRRFPRTHDGTIMTSRSNERWRSDALEFTCWNGEIVRVAFALDSHEGESSAGWPQRPGYPAR
jgi:transposase InsO family protein